MHNTDIPVESCLGEIVPMKIVTVVSFLFFIFTPLMSLADISTVASSGKDRPKIGLVLSGGGARGAAHVGVIRRLEEPRRLGLRATRRTRWEAGTPRTRRGLRRL